MGEMLCRGDGTQGASTAAAEATETQVWLDFAHDCGYLSPADSERLKAGYEEVGKMLSAMIANPGKFAPG